MSQLVLGTPIGKIFVPAGMPTVTYQPRESVVLERKVMTAIEDGHKIISLSGPTKSGKTVLLRKVLTNPIWMEGGAIGDIDSFWSTLSAALRAPTQLTISDESSAGGSDTRSVGGTLGVLNTGVTGGRQSSSDHGSSHGVEKTLTRSNKDACLGILSTEERPLVIDDFHYIDAEVQIEIVRSLKAPVFNGLRAIFISVPHRSFDPVGSAPSSPDIGFEHHAAWVAANANSNSTGVSLPRRRWRRRLL